MGKDSAIQWTHHTFNPWRGCSKVSPGCTHCYAETLSNRNPAVLGKWGPNGTRVVASESKWREPLAWDRAAKVAGERHRVFCASLADVFEDWAGPMVDSRGRVLHYNSAATWWVPEETMHGPIRMDFVRERLFSLIEATPNLDWLILTKRPENIHGSFGAMPNVWLGTTVENQEQADLRIPILLETPAAVRFLSMEPLLGPVDLGDWDHECGDPSHGNCPVLWPDWVIVGGESGPKARPFDLAWARSIGDQCQVAKVPCFVKQLGSSPFDSRGADGFPGAHKVYASVEEAKSPAGIASLAITLELMAVDLENSHGGDWDEWPADLRVRQFPSPLTSEAR